MSFLSSLEKTLKNNKTKTASNNPRYTTSISPEQQKKNNDIFLKELKGKDGAWAAATAYLVKGAFGSKEKYMNPEALAVINANPKLKSAANVAEVVGTMAQFAVPYGAATKAITSIPKIAKAGELIGKALTKTPLLEKTAMTLGGKIAGSVATDLAVGVPLNVNYALNTQDLKGKEAVKSILTNTGLDLVTGGLMEAVPAVYKGIKGIGGTKVLNVEKSIPNVPKSDNGFPKDLEAKLQKQDEWLKANPNSVDAPLPKEVKKESVGYKRTPQEEANLAKFDEMQRIANEPKVVLPDNAKIEVEAPVEPKVTEVTPDLKAVKTAEQVQKEYAQPIQQSAKNQYDSAPVEAQTILQDRINRGDVDLVSRKQKDALDIAVDKVNKDPVKARQELDLVTNFTDRDLALTEALKTYYKQIGDMDNYVEMVVKASNALSETGRSLSAARMLFNATPEGRTASVIRNIKNVQEKYAKRIDGDIEIDPVKIERLGNAQTPEEMDSIIQEIGIDTWNQIPGSMWEKFNAFRRTSLLLNPKTMIRNFLGNIVFVPARAGKNAVASGLESAFKRAGVLDTKTQSILNMTNADDVARINFGKEIFDENAPSIMSNSRFSETARPIEANVYGSTPIGQVLEWTRRLTGKGLEGGDKLILKPAYSHALARYMKANNLLPSTITKEELALAENVAREEALRSTFRDAHFISDALIKYKAIEGKSAFHKAVGIALEGTVPFVKTPLNVVRRAFDYSPIGITKGVVRIMKAAKEGNNAGVVRGIDNLASGLTGTGLIALGYYLGSIGVLNGRIPYDEYGNFQKGQGEQGYSINIGDTSVTVDWITPAILPMLTGVEIAKQVVNGGFDPMRSIEALGDIATPVTELSMMSGFADVLESASNSDSAGATVIGTALTPFMNYAGQYIPTVSGQIARAIDPVRRSTTSTAETATGRRIEKFYNKQKAKIPGLSKTLEPFVDAWGREQTASTYDRTVENFLTPFYTSKKNVTPVDEEITALYKDLSEDERNKILPKLKSGYTVSFEGDQVRLSPEDMTLFNKDKGKASFKQLSDLISTEEYKTATGTEKADMIAKIYTETTKIAKIDTLISQGKDEWKVWTDDMEGGKANYQEVKDSGLAPKDYYYLFKDTELNGKSGTNQYEAYQKLESTDLTTEQKAILWNKYNTAWKNNPYRGGDIPTETASSGGSSSGSGGGSSKTTTGLATKQINKLKTLNLDTDNQFTKAELKAIIKMLS